MKIGVIGVQGAVLEHLRAVERAMEKLGIDGGTTQVRKRSDLSNVDGVILPGGESTSIGQLMQSAGMFEKVRKMGRMGVPIMGTCAGMILLAKEGGEEVRKADQPLLGLMDAKVVRNAFGRQKESFEANLEIPSLGVKPFPGVFIRAPGIASLGKDAEPLADYEGYVVAAEQENFIAIAFHPELTLDTRAHEYFLEKVAKYRNI